MQITAAAVAGLAFTDAEISIAFKLNTVQILLLVFRKVILPQVWSSEVLA